MSNTTNVQAIITNLETIVGTTLGFNLELSLASDPDVDTTASAQILYQGEDFMESFGEKPLSNELDILIKIQFREETPGDIRDLAVGYVHKLREGITINLLNVGALSASKMVSRVDHGPAEVEPDHPITEIDYHLKIRYREV
jgi:hypothetical protein